jgi:hypothetical protein
MKVSRRMITVIELNDDAVEAANLRHALRVCVKLEKILRLLSGESHVERIGTQIQIPRPFERSEFRDSNLFEDSAAFPCFEHAAPDSVTKIDDARDAVVETEKQFVLFEWLRLCDLHNESYIKTVPSRKPGHWQEIRNGTSSE